MKEAYKHDYSGEYSPSKNGTSWNQTFSVGCFQWLPKSGKGLKRGRVKFRVKGGVRLADKVYVVAEQFCRDLDNGWIPTRKSMTVRG